MMRVYSVFQYAPIADDQYIFTTTPIYCVPPHGTTPTDGDAANFAFERIRPYASHPLVIQCHYLN